MFDAKILPSCLSFVEGGERLIVETVLRYLPGKRLVVKATWQGQAVVAKLFYQTRSTKKYLTLEANGYRALQQAKLPTPKRLQQAKVSDENNTVYTAILYEYIESASSQINDDDIIALVAKQHESSLMQTDCHRNNYLLRDKVLYTLDLASIVKVNAKKPLTLKQGVKNLAAYMAQISCFFDEKCEYWLRYYVACRAQPLTPKAMKQARYYYQQASQKLYQERMKKVVRNSTEFQTLKTKTFSVIMRREIGSEAVMDFFKNPEALMQQGEMVKVGNSSTVVKAQLAEKTVLIKRYNMKSFWHGVKRAYQKGRAWRSWQNGYRLMHYGIATPKPLALLQQKKFGLKRCSYLVFDYLEGESLNDYLSGENWTVQKLATIAAPLSHFFKVLSVCHLSHGDLKATNWRVSDNTLYITDLDSMRAGSYNTAKDRVRFLKNWQAAPALQRYFQQII